MSVKLTWRVADPPTGRYRSFYPRGWPSAQWPSGQPAAVIYCDDSYTPARGRGEATHGPLKVCVADHSVRTAEGRPTFRWRTCSHRPETLAEAKALAERVLGKHPEFHPQDVTVSEKN